MDTPHSLLTPDEEEVFKTSDHPLLLFRGSKALENVPPAVHITKPVFKFGRAKGQVDLCFDSKARPCMISRIHAVLSLEEDCWTLLDCKSLNGIFVNGVKINKATLRDNDLIVFGEGGAQSIGTKLLVANPDLAFLFKDPGTNKSVKRKQPEPEVDELQQHEAKRFKESEEAAKLREELQRKEQMLEEQRRKMEEASKFKEEMELLQEEKRKLEEAMKSKREQDQFEEQRKVQEALQQKEEELKEKFLENQRKQAVEAQLLQAELEMKEKILEEERQRLDRENALKELELQAQKAELENQRKLFQEELAKKLTEMESLKQASIPTTDIEEEFTCTICHGMMIFAHTLECSHSFCGTCIEEWMKQKKMCPVCRQAIMRVPLRSLNLDNVIEKVVQKLPEAEQQEWKTRAAKLKKEEEELKQLKTLMSAARMRGLRFLNITDNWTPEEQKIFADGVGRYLGKSRVLYCEMTNLTPHFANTCPLPQLYMALKNVGVTGITSSTTAARLRQALLDYICKSE